MEKYNKITRVEVIDKTGRVYTNYDAKNVMIDFQDSDKTLKIFIDKQFNNKDDE